MKIINLPEDLGIKTIQKFYNNIVEMLRQGTEYVIDFSQVRRIDLSAAQLVIALERECGRQGWSCYMINMNDTIARLLELAGAKFDAEHRTKD